LLIPEDYGIYLIINADVKFHHLGLVMDDSHIRNRKSRFFPRIKKSKSRFYNKLVHRFLSMWNTLYSIVITWRHFGKLEIVAVINNPILRASLQIRQLLTGCTTQGDQRTIMLRHPPRAPHVIHDTGEVGGAGGGRL